MRKRNLLPTSEPIKILRKLQALGFTSAIIAGGAVRDDYNDQMINDYDIFLWDPRVSHEPASKLVQKMGPTDVDMTEMQFTKILARIIGNEMTQLMSNDDTNGYAESMGGDDSSIGAKLTAIWECWTDYNLYQVIFTQADPVAHVEEYFDLGICKAYCDGKKIRYTEDFMRDIKNKTLTICGREMTFPQFEYVMNYHIPKIQWKYPGFTIVVPDYNQHLMEAYNTA